MTASKNMVSETLAARFEEAAKGFSRNRNLCADILVEFGDEKRIVCIRQGTVERIEAKIPLLFPWVFAIRASNEAWEALWERFPKPGWHDIFALSKRGELRMGGNLQPMMAHLQYVKDLLASPRKEA